MSKKVFITYDRYEHDEWFNIYEVTTDRTEMKKNYKKNLLDFITYGPDDCHSYQIQVVNLSDEDYETLMRLYTTVDDPYDTELDDFMTKIYEECDWNRNCLLVTDGCSDFVEIVKMYCEEQGLDPEDDDEYQDCWVELCDNYDLCVKMTKKYIDKYYRI